MRVIGAEGEQLGIMTSKDAYMMAQDKGLDLVEVSPNADPPTCKILDYGKWKYDQKKKEKASKKNQTVTLLKEVQVRLRTEEHDFMVKMKRAQGFLEKKHKVKISLRFQGREMAYQEQGFALLNKVAKVLESLAVIESPPKKENRQMFMVLAPTKEK